MSPTATRFFFAGALALTPFAESGCVPSGASFSPASGVLTVSGTQNADAYVVTANTQGAIVVNGGSVPIQGGTPTLANTTRIVLLGRGGDDQLVLDPHGGALPGARVVGGPGTDVIVGGAGGDEFVWVAGDGEDVIDGRGGADTLLYTASDGVDTVHVVTSAGHALVIDTQSDVTVDLAGVENVAVFAVGGADAIVVGELTGSAVASVRVDLAGAAGAGDGVSDALTVLATQGPDVVSLESAGGAVEITGLAAAVRITNGEAADDLVLATLGGDDDVDAGATAAGGIALAVNGGLGVDSFLGGAGDDWFGGGDGDDVAVGGPGDDTFVWNPGDDDDTLEGEDDFDTLLFNGANAAEIVEITAAGARARLTRNIASVVTDLAGVEAIHYRALAGADLLAVRDLSSTDVAEVSAILTGPQGTGDGEIDGVIVDGSAADDAIQVYGDASGVVVTGLAAQVSITGSEDPGDGLTIGTFAGHDTIDASALATPSLQLTADGGEDHDVLIGGDGGDVLLGGDGDDVLLGGPGLDVLDGGAGDNIVIQ